MFTKKLARQTGIKFLLLAMLCIPLCRWGQAAAPVNDNFANAINLTAMPLPISVTGNNTGATMESGATPAEPITEGSLGASVWWSWKAPSNMTVTVSLLGSSFDTVLGVYSDTNIGAPSGAANRFSTLTPVVSNDDFGNGTLQSQVTFNAAASTMYRIQVGGYFSASGNINLGIQQVTAPANDNFANAISLTGALPITATGSNVSATFENAATLTPVEPSPFTTTHFGASVWWTWTAAATGQFSISLAGSDYNTEIAVYSDTNSGAPSNAVNRFSTLTQAGSGVSSVTFNAVLNNVYRIQIGGFDSQTGNISLKIDFFNDNIAGAIDLTSKPLPITVSGSNVGATAEASEPAHAGVPAAQSVWWKWTAPASGKITISTAGSTSQFSAAQLDTLLSIYTSSAPLAPTVTNITAVVENDNYGFDQSGTANFTSQATFAAQSGKTYFIAVDGTNDSNLNFVGGGSITLTLRTANSPANDDFSSATSLTGALPIIANGSNIEASLETAAGESQILATPGAGSVWWSWTAPASQKVTISTAGSTKTAGPSTNSLNTLLAVYTGASVGTLGAPISANDDFGTQISKSGAASQINTSQLTFAASAGTKYMIKVDGVSTNSGFDVTEEGQIILLLTAPPANDDVVNAAKLTGTLPIIVSGANQFASLESLEPATIAGITTSQTVWWKWTASAAQSVTVSTAGSNFDTVLAVYSASGGVPPFSNLTLLTANDDFPGTITTSGAVVRAFQSQVTFAASNGVTYFIAVDGKSFGFTGGVSGTIVLTLASPGNDNIASVLASGPFDLSSTPLPVVKTSNNFFASKESGEPVVLTDVSQTGKIDQGSSSVWWRWTATSATAGPLTVSMAGSDITGVLGVYSASAAVPPFSNLTTVGNSFSNNGNFFSGGTDQAQVTFTAVSGTTYFIQVDGSSYFGGPFQGNYTLTLAKPPTNDNFVNAIDLSSMPLPVTTSGSNQFASLEVNEPQVLDQFGNSVQGGSSVWWKWTPSGSQRITVSTLGTGFETLLGVYTGSAVDLLTPLGSDDNVNAIGQSQVQFNAVAGTTYMIQVDGSNGQSGNINLNIAPPPANDNFANAIDLTAMPLPLSTTGSNQFASMESGELEHSTNAAVSGIEGSSVWWKWTAPATQKMIVSTAGSNFDTVLEVSTGATVTGLSVVASNDNFGTSLQSQVSFVAQSGITYSIVVDGALGVQGSLINLTLRKANAPANDDFTNAIDLTSSPLPIVTTGTNIDATKELGEPDHAGNIGGSSVWWRWTSPAGNSTQPITISTAGSNFRTLLGVYTSAATPSVATLSGVSSSTVGQLSFSAAPGTTYFIAVDGFSGAAGNITLTLAAPPPNDNFSNAIVLTSTVSGGALQPLTTSGTNVGATLEKDAFGNILEPTPKASNAGGASVWWSWTAPLSQNVVVSTFGSNFDTLLAVYSGSTLANLVSVAENDNFAGQKTSELSFAAVAGTTYTIAVDGLNLSGVRGALIGNITLGIRTFSLPDLTVTSIAQVTANPVLTGSPITFSVTVQNLGGEAAGAFAVGFYRNLAAAPLQTSTPDQTQTISFLAGGGASNPLASATVSFTVPTPANNTAAALTQSAWAFADQANKILESDETNNAGPQPSGFTWSVLPQPPIISSSATDTGTVGVAYKYQITTVGSATSFTATGLPPEFVFNTATGTITGASTNPAGSPVNPTGTFNVSLAAVNAGGTGPAFKLTLTLNAAIVPQITNSPLSLNLPLDVPMTPVQITTAPLAAGFSAAGLPAGLSIDPILGIISGTLTDPNALSVTITASNAFNGSSSAIFSITVNASPPVFGSVAAAPGVAGTPYSYALQASSPLGAGALTFTAASALPNGLSLSGGTISGTPAVFGTFILSIVATDTKGNSTTASITLQIADPQDLDGDGFPNEMETALGSNPNDPASTPFGIKLNSNGNRAAMGISSVKFKLNFTAQNTDNLAISGFFLPVPAAPSSLDKQIFILDFGGVVQSFVLNSKGVGPKGNNQIKASLKGGALNYSVKLNKGSFAATLSKAGLTNANASNAVKQVSVLVVFNSTMYQKNPQFLSYTSKQGHASSSGIGTDSNKGGSGISNLPPAGTNP